MSIPELIEEWRRIAKAQMDSIDDFRKEGFYEDSYKAANAANIYTRCADDLEKALRTPMEQLTDNFHAYTRTMEEKLRAAADETVPHPPRTGEGV